MSQPTTVTVGTLAIKLVESSRGGNRTHARKGVILSIISTEPAPVFLAYGSQKGLTTANGEPLYPGQSKHIVPEEPVVGGVQDMAIYAIATTNVIVRVQELL